jgi:hypothetical protein
MSGIIWLASYPKSGNTWCSIFLANLLSGRSRPIDISQPLPVENFAARELFDRLIGWQSSELSPALIASLRLPAQVALARDHSLPIVKTHDAFSDPQDGRPLFSAEAMRCAWYLIRNPLDVVVSLSHHAGMTLDQAIGFLNDPRAASFTAKNWRQIPQLLLDWSSHVASWADAAGVRVLVVRYEDLLRAPEETFLAASMFAGLTSERARVRQALEFSRFEDLQRQEAESGFAEAPSGRPFFRAGRSGSWRSVLSEAQVAAVVERHETMMRRFGYWPDEAALATSAKS